MKTKVLFTVILLTASLNLNASTSFINNKIIDSTVQYKELRTPYFKSLSNLKRDYQDTADETRRFSKFTQQPIIDIRKEKYDFFNTKKWTPPKIATYSYQNFGIWDAAFLWYALENYQDEKYALLFHHHQDDPGIQLFKKEVNRFSNIDPKYKNFLYRIGQKGFKEDIDRDYLPREISASIALSEHNLHYDIDSKDDTLRIGVENFNSYQTNLCEQWKNSNYLSLNVECTELTSNERKINNFFNGEKDAIIIQSDSLSSFLKEKPVTQGFQGVILRKEYLFMITPKDSDVFQLNDLKNTKHELNVFSIGLKKTLNIIGNKLPEYKTVFSNINVLSGADPHIDSGIKYQNDILFISCDLKECPKLDLINEKYSEKYEMIPINFWQLLNEKDPMGNRIYTQSVIPYKHPNIQNPDIYQKHDIKHIGFYNYLIISDYWFEYHKEYIRELEEFLRNL